MNPDTGALDVTMCLAFPQEYNVENVVIYSVADGEKYFSTKKGNGDKPRPLTDTYDAFNPQIVG